MVAERRRRSPRTRPPRTHKLTWPLMLLSFTAGMTAIVLATLGASPVVAESTTARHRLVSVVQRSVADETAPRTGALLSSTMSITVPRQLKPRFLTITTAAFYREDGERLGTSKLSLMRSSWDALELVGMDALQEATGQLPDSSALPLSPLTRTEILLRATAEEDLGLEPGTRIYLQVEGSIDGEPFVARSDPAPAEEA